jgi:hypothetical protein
MKKLYGLFNDQEEAGDAVEALAAAGFEDADIHQIENSGDLETDMVAVAPIHGGGYGAATPLTYPSFLSDLGDTEVRGYLHRSLKNGGVLVVIEPADDEAHSKIKHILEEAGGQVTS